MVTPPPEMPSVEDVSRVIYQTAFYDHLLALPVGNTLQAIRDLRLERFLPSYFDFERGRVADTQAFDAQVRSECLDNHLTPQAVLERLQRERRELSRPSLDPFEELNYRLINEVLSISSAGDVSPLAYKVATGRISTETGIEVLSNLYFDVRQEITGKEEHTFHALIQAQVLSEHRRFIDQLPVLEEFLGGRRQASEDSALEDALSLARYGPNGMLLLPQKSSS